jgi:ribosomal protein S12 methylthiotransferase accessory factor
MQARPFDMTVSVRSVDDASALHHVRPVALTRAPKHGGAGPHRIVSARVAWTRVRHAIGLIGITRLADLTGLDSIGVPTWSAVRPLADRFSVSVTCGKGLRSIDARVGAVMEAVEYWSAEPLAARMHVARLADLSGDAIDPEHLVLPQWARRRSGARLAWIGAWDLTRHSPVWVPANAVCFPFESQPGEFLFTPTTNGLAAGLALEEAVCHALAELIERDAWSLVCARLWTGGGFDACPILDPESMPLRARTLVGRFERCGVRVLARVITSDLGVPAVHATSVEPGPQGPLVHEGIGAHPDAEVALLRALTEVAQSRAADIQGSREDLTFWRARSAGSAGPADAWIDGAQQSRRMDFASMAGFRSSAIRDDIDWMIARLRAARLDRVVVADLTSPAVGLPVVRVIVPGLEVTCVDPWRVGRRAEAVRAGTGGVAVRGGERGT